jgi:hypothetical protein
MQPAGQTHGLKPVMANDECASVPVQESLSSLAEYLLLPLNAGESIIMMAAAESQR